jgi:MoaA/NifB/PqqE/SkfB family radical SAM enzyme
MELKVFRKILHEVSSCVHSAIRFIGWGEPLLHPNLIAMVRESKEIAPNIPLTLITNGYFLSENIAYDLMDAGLNLIEISIDAAYPESYAKRRCSKDKNAFNVVTSNVKKMLEYKNKFSTKIVVSYIVYPTKSSEEEFDVFSHYWKNLVDEIIKRPAHSFKGILPDIRKPPTHRPPCKCLWSRCSINPFGEISACYNDWERTDILGDLNDSKTTIRKIWKSNLLNAYRNEQCQGKFKGICLNCHDYNSDAWKYPYDLVIERCRK